MDTLPEEIQNTIYKYEHQLKYHDVMKEFHECMEDLICYCCNCGAPYMEISDEYRLQYGNPQDGDN